MAGRAERQHKAAAGEKVSQTRRPTLGWFLYGGKVKGDGIRR